MAILLLASCEPSHENADDEGTPSHDRSEKKRLQLLRDKANPERIAAQESLGKPPLPRNLVSDIADVCPVHHAKMTIREIPIVIADEPPWKTETPSAPPTDEFPFGAENIVSSSHMLIPGDPVTARVYQCPACIAARRAAETKRTSATAVSASR